MNIGMLSNIRTAARENIDRSNAFLKPTLCFWFICAVVFGLFPLWSATMHFGVQDWEVLALGQDLELPPGASLAWKDFLPNFFHRFLYNTYDYRPLYQAWTHFQMIIAHGQWWVMYLCRLLEITICASLMLLIGRALKLGFYPIMALVVVFLFSNKPQAPNLTNDSYFVTAAALLTVYVMILTTSRIDDHRSTTHLRFLALAVWLSLATLCREYLFGFIIPCIIAVHFLSVAHRRPSLHLYMILPWITQAWVLWKLTSASGERGVFFNFDVFFQRLIGYLAMFPPIRFGGALSDVVVGLLLLGLVIALACGAKSVWNSRNPNSRVPILVATFFAGAIGMVILLAVPRPAPVWARYVVPCATLFTAASIYGITRIRQRILSAAICVLMIVCIPLLGLSDRYYDQWLNLRYMNSVNKFIETAVNLQLSGANLYVDDVSFFDYPENFETLERIFGDMGRRYYGLPGTPLKPASDVTRDGPDSFYFIAKNHSFVDFSRFEAEWPGYRVSEVLGFFSDQPLGFDIATAFWVRVARRLTQTDAFGGWHIGADTGMDPGYYILHVERSPNPGFDRTRAIAAPAIPSQSVKAEPAVLQSLSADFTAPDTGWYMICHSPIIRNDGGPVALSLAAGEAPIRDFDRGYTGNIDARPFQLIKGQTRRVGVFARTVQGVELSFVNHDTFAICPVKALGSGTGGFGRLF